MSYEKSFYHSNSQDNQNSYSKQKLDRRSTRLTSQPAVYPDHANLQDFSQASIQASSPVDTSQQGSSIQVKYLSYLAKVIDSAPQGSDSEEIQTHYHKAEYWNFIYQSAIYVKKDNYRTQIDDKLMIEQFEDYLLPDRIHPVAKNEIGQRLLCNGYFVSAFAIALGRKRKSFFLFKYIMQYIQNELQLQTNYQEFLYLLENFVYLDRAEEVLHLNISQTPRQYRYEKQRENRAQNYNHQTTLRRHFLQTSNYEQYEDSKTVILDDELQSNLNH